MTVRCPFLMWPPASIFWSLPAPGAAANDHHEDDGSDTGRQTTNNHGGSNAYTQAGLENQGEAQ